MKKLAMFALVLALLAPTAAQARGIFDLRLVQCAKFWDPPDWCDNWIVPDEEPGDEWSIVPDAEGDEWAQ